MDIWRYCRVKCNALESFIIIIIINSRVVYIFGLHLMNFKESDSYKVYCKYEIKIYIKGKILRVDIVTPY